jgi:hypothetical protein
MTFISMTFGTTNVVRYMRGKEVMKNITTVRRLHPTVALMEN